MVGGSWLLVVGILTAKHQLPVAEVELHNADEHVDLPSWLGAVVVRDVTGESAFSNASLATEKQHVEPTQVEAPEDLKRTRGRQTIVSATLTLTISSR